MKIFIMTDMEGCAGILNHDDWVMPESIYYEKGKRLLTEEVNAAIAGFFEADATEIVVADGHGYGGIDPELLDDRALLWRGWSAHSPYPFGLDKSFSALAVIGQHAKAGTPYSHITHTGWFSVLDETVNGISIGEYGDSYRNAKLGAIHLSPFKARTRIKAGAYQALNKLKENPAAFTCVKIDPPYALNKKCRKNGDNPSHEINKTHPG